MKKEQHEEPLEYSDSDVIYQITVGDLRAVAGAVLRRNLTEKEIESVIGELPDTIDWFDTIEKTFSTLGFQPSDDDEFSDEALLGLDADDLLNGLDLSDDSFAIDPSRYGDFDDEDDDY